MTRGLGSQTGTALHWNEANDRLPPEAHERISDSLVLNDPNSEIGKSYR
jgi:hypothetical protein